MDAQTPDRVARVVVVVGNPTASSRTRDAGVRLARALVDGPATTIELADMKAALFDAGNEVVSAAVAAVRSADLVIFASPVYKASYTGLLKLFLDLIPGRTGLTGVVAVPLMLGASCSHALSPELALRPVLAELGAIVPAPGLFLVDSTYTTDDVADEYAQKWSPVIRQLLPSPRR